MHILRHIYDVEDGVYFGLYKLTRISDDKIAWVRYRTTEKHFADIQVIYRHSYGTDRTCIEYKDSDL